MSDLKSSYKLSELPENLGLSPKFLLDWWSQVIKKYGLKDAQDNHSPDFKLARELWVAAAFAVCMRVTDPRDYWISAVNGEAPDAFVFSFEVDVIGAKRNIYQIEVTTFDDRSTSIEEVLLKKLQMQYDPTTRIICYITRSDGSHVNLKSAAKYVVANNSQGYEVWILDEFTPLKDTSAGHPIKLSCLTTGADIQVDLFEEQQLANRGDAVWVPTVKAINKTGQMNLLGKIELKFPS